MNSDSTNVGLTHSSSTRKARPPRPTQPQAHPGVDEQPRETASPAAMDEVFAMLARNVERMQRSHARVRRAEPHAAAGETSTAVPASATPSDSGTIRSKTHWPPRQPIDPSSFRSLDAEMDRQRERLAQLLRDIEGTAAAE